jgi:hypothetical protein
MSIPTSPTIWLPSDAPDTIIYKNVLEEWNAPPADSSCPPEIPLWRVRLDQYVNILALLRIRSWISAT